MGPFGQLGMQHQQHQTQGTHLSGFGGSEYYGDNQRVSTPQLLVAFMC